MTFKSVSVRGPNGSRPLVIGMLGGMSWESSSQYFRLANEMVRDRLGGLHSARCVLASVDFAEIEAQQAGGQWEQAGAALAHAAQGVQAAGADLLLLCTNTMHKVADQIQGAIDIPLIHVADATAVAVRESGSRTIGLLGTAFTMEQDFYIKRLAGHGLQILLPDATARAEVHRIIYEELCVGVIRDESRCYYQAVIDQLARAGAEGVVLACTEIGLLINQTDSPIPVFDTTHLHVQAGVDASLASRLTPPTRTARSVRPR